MKNQFVELSIPTPDGEFIVRYSEKGLAEMDFPNGRAELPLGLDARQRVPTAVSRWHRATEIALKNLLAGRGAKNLPPLDLSGGTEFQQAV